MLGVSFDQLGEPKIAAEQFQAAYTLYLGLIGPDHPTTLATKPRPEGRGSIGVPVVGPCCVSDATLHRAPPGGLCPPLRATLPGRDGLAVELVRDGMP